MQELCIEIHSVPLHESFAALRLHVRALAGKALLTATKLCAMPTALHSPEEVYEEELNDDEDDDRVNVVIKEGA